MMYHQYQHNDGACLCIMNNVLTIGMLHISPDAMLCKRHINSVYVGAASCLI
jgi:hypothetical protein